MAAAASRYGKLWGRGHETFPPSIRRILSIKGKGNAATTYLQGLVTSDLMTLPPIPRMIPMPSPLKGDDDDDDDDTNPPIQDVKFSNKMRSTCFLDQKGRIVTDALLWKLPFEETDEDSVTESDTPMDDSHQEEEVEYLIDVPGDVAPTLLQHLKKYKLRRSKVTIGDVSDDFSVHCIYGTLNAQGAPPGYLAVRTKSLLLLLLLVLYLLKTLKHVLSHDIYIYLSHSFCSPPITSLSKAMDPRHPSLGMRILSSSTPTSPTTHDERQETFSNMVQNFFPKANGTFDVLRKLSGVAQGSEIVGKTALECNQEWINSVSFKKGCYLGQELTARSQFTGVVRKRIMPLILIDTQTEVPRPWLTAHKVQELGLENLQQDNLLGLGIELELEGGESLPPLLPQVSAAGVGGIISMLQGGNMTQQSSKDNENDVIDNGNTSENGNEEMQRLQTASQALLENLEEVAIPGAKIVDKKDGKTIGTIISSPASGTPVVLAQMRLDQVGLLGGKTKWNRLNQITIGDDAREFRYLPFMPLWWPDKIDPKTGKEQDST